MLYRKTFYIFLLAIILLNISIIYATNLNNDNYKYFRVHIVANSDSIDDQLLKYTIAKEVNEYIENITKSCTTKNEAKQVVKQNIQTILNICDSTVKENNKEYSVKAYIGKIEYDEKSFNNYYMDSGIYDSLKIEIGNANGQNWWSLIYPTLFSNTSTEEIFDESTTFSFGIIDFIQNILTLE